MSEEPDATIHSFSADRPIKGRSDDRLRRKGFAEAIARAIGQWRGSDSLVVALYGPWGSGKSSLKNMVVETLQDGPELSRVTLIDFNPWQFSSRENLTKAFFDEVGIALGQPQMKDDEKRQAAWRKYAAFLEAGSSLADVLRSRAVIALWLLAAVFFGMTIMTWSPVASVLFVLISFTAELLKRSAVAARALATFFGERARVNQSTLLDLKKRTAEQLESRPTPLLVVMDDVDRLAPDEVREVFRLVKVHADFPKLVYLLLFQRDVIERSLDEPSLGRGREFLEKIVQVGFDLPRMDQKQVQEILFSELNRLLAYESVGRRFNIRRWASLFGDGLGQYFTSLRRVYRFITTLEFHVGVFREGDSFEANPVDLIGIEALRVFEPEIYDAVAANRSLFVGREHPILDREAGKVEDRSGLNSILETIPANRRAAVQAILGDLFPRVKEGLGVFGGESVDEDALFRDLRVASRQMFDRYFRFFLSEEDLPQSKLDLLLRLASAGDREGLRRELKALSELGLLLRGIDGLRVNKSELPLYQAEPFVTAIFDLSEDLPADEEDPFRPTPDLYAYWLVDGYLRRYRDQRRQAAILRNAISKTDGIALPAAMLAWEGHTDERPTDAQERLTTDEDLKVLKDLCVANIKRAAEAGTLMNIRRLRLVLECWKDWGQPNEVRSFCEKIAQDPEQALRFIRAFVIGVRRTPMGEGVGTTYRYLRLGDIEDLVPWKRIFETFKTERMPLSNDDREIYEAFQNAVHRRRQGKPDFDSRSIMLEEESDQVT